MPAPVIAYPNGNATTLGLSDLEVSGINLPYRDILNATQGGYIYVINKMRIIASSLSQLTQPVVYTRKDAGGIVNSMLYRYELHPEQVQPVGTFDVDMVFDGKSRLDISPLAGQTMNMFFGGRVYTISEYLNVGGDLDMLKKLEGRRI